MIQIQNYLLECRNKLSSDWNKVTRTGLVYTVKKKKSPMLKISYPKLHSAALRPAVIVIST